MYDSETNMLLSRKTDSYEFILHMHGCQINIVYL